MNQRNPGLGIEWVPSRNWTLALGEYWNSYRRTTVYALAQLTPLHFGDASGWHLDAGIAAGLASGYRRDEVPTAPLAGAAVVCVAAPSGISLKVVAVPNTGAYRSSFIGFQLALPLPK